MLNVDRRGRAREDVVWLPVDSTNSGIQIVAAARRREENHEQIWAKNKVSVDRSRFVLELTRRAVSQQWMHADGVLLDSSHLFVLSPLFQSEITTCPFAVVVVCFAFCVVRLGTDAIIVMGELREL